ncbi:DEAD/DEAH box helicase [Chroogloeocystis siderophila]|uniref:ATP-dependent helicase n=1 Tax=Chroogloeocystis siderophila 5.2 s.c.1 TaxID=247279 RepID=A0A1U7I0D3_9CHRO|nr:DEAD/DEAH box helicase [Chroogloeocystis siderophila]OKH29306.1 ATP-dependent helicase [Chroogloeocystis siderophila 5.2 s.c.1]
MSKDTFHKLAPFIQQYIYEHNWNELRLVQVAACEVIFDTDAHLLITAGTAAGKTEAAFLPVLTLLHEQPPSTIGALYIGPIKALINDQFQRLNDLVKEADIPIWHWHGDVSQSRKNKLLKNPKGILQITPESLEGLLLRKHHDLTRLFGDLRFVIIDEIHAFMGSERGYQILCQLARLENVTHNYPRRIGLSATLGDYSLAEKWLASGTNRTVITPQIESEKRQIKLAVEHFYINTQDSSNYHKYIFNLSHCKCLIFANNRSQTESVIASLRQLAQAEGLPDIYHVHHGSISASLREAAEKAMRHTPLAVTAATLTLELGIDIGQLERVIQLEAPLSVASFLQRLGRTGRRGEPADMRFVCAENELSLAASLPAQIPWQLLQCIAIIQLYLEERWIEPIQPLEYPLSLLYHQTMSILAAMGESSPAVLAQQVLSLPPFSAISKDDYRILLRYLIDIDHIQHESGKLIIGLAGEKVISKFQFYAVFPDNEEYTVKNDSTEIGSILTPPPVGDQFSLAGRTWEVLDVDFKRKTIVVKQVAGSASIAWRGGSGNIHTKVMQRMRKVLLEDIEYSYLQQNARDRLKKARQLARRINLDNIVLENDACYLFPWMGTVAYRTLERVLNYCLREDLEIKSITGTNPYYLKLKGTEITQLYDVMTSLGDRSITTQDLVAAAEAPRIQKYDEFIPPGLLRKAFTTDYLDLDELKQCIAIW